MKNPQNEIKLSQLFYTAYGMQPEITSLTGGGSPRDYYRLKAGDIEVVGVYCNEINENEIFIRLDKCLEDAGIRVPHVIAIDNDMKCYLQQDLGDVMLLERLGGEEGIALARQALNDLINIQFLPEKSWEDKVGFAPFSERLVRWDLNYFKYDFLKPSGIAFDEDALENDFDRLTSRLVNGGMTEGFMYRDFQSRNIMVREGQLWFIDFQGARKGPLVYDAVSFIWQAKAPFSYEEREALEKYYIELLSGKTGVDVATIYNGLKTMTLFRVLQVLGAYGFRGLIERKAHFLESISQGVANLQYLHKRGDLNEFPQIVEIAERLASKYLKKADGKNDGLTLKVISFSYKKGYPEDSSGNGGGFMFDCRGIHNPGRYPEYKNLNGRDREVVEFLEQTREAENFIDNAIKIVNPSIERYVARGFTSLQVGFGCTGGQHRSVYCAEKFARIIKNKFPEVNVELLHREQRIEEKIEK